ncbi:hypothetical protein BSKO_13756 [Bryopsis sp. KO-2023]|nr:hypothetical protein BSKO_13756 [Bryopsis sp. KO-2023]
MAKIDLGTVPSDDDFAKDPQVWDLVIVGAGVAGASLAYSQGKDGRRVLLLEKDLRQPDRIVGELLQPGGYLALKKLGLEEAVQGIDAQKVYGYALFKDGQDCVIKYPTEGMSEDVAGRSFHHGRFVQRLRQKAQEQPSVTIRQGTARNLLDESGNRWEEEGTVTGVSYKDSEGVERSCRAHLTIVCDGMYSSFRKKFIQPEIHHPSHFVGLKIRGGTLPHPNHGHVVLAKPSPILVYPISSDVSRVLVDVPGEKLPSKVNGGLEQYLRTSVAPELPECLRDGFLEAVESGEIRSVQNKQMAAKPLHQPGALLLGDAYNMRHPLTGGGMTVALSDCFVLSQMLEPFSDFSNAESLAKCSREFHDLRKPLSGTINTLANALYSVFQSGDDAHEEMRQACFEYLGMGGIYSQGPMSLLSGLNPKPLLLIMHFFMVAIYGATSFSWKCVWERLTSPKQLWLRVRLLADATGIILPIVRDEGFNMFFPKGGETTTVA